MRDIIGQMEQWARTGKGIAFATVVNTWGSAPRKAGAHMAVNEDGDIAGSVSGGCVEGAVVEKAMAVLEGGKAGLLHFGIQDETAWEVGLACGGEIDVFVRPIPESLISFAARVLRADEELRMWTIIGGTGESLGKHLMQSGDQTSNCTHDWDDAPEDKIEVVRSVPRRSAIQIETVILDGEEHQILLQSITPAPTLLVVGGAHIAIALTEIAHLMGFRTVVIDPRKVFGSKERFPHIDALMQRWPQDAMREVGINSNTAVVTLSHDPKIDDPALISAVPSEAFYVGALGSKKTHQKRKKRLAETGMAKDYIEKIHSPVGLDIGAEEPEEIALAIMAEIVAARSKAAD